jgi:hypothetical protein
MKSSCFEFFLFIGFIWLATASSAFCQDEFVANSNWGYYVKDNVRLDRIAIENANRFERAERVVIVNQAKHKDIVYYPNDIQEYGLSDGHRYVSIDLKIGSASKKVFVEEILNLDSLIVYSYANPVKEYFFIQRKNELPKQIKDEDEFWKIFRNDACPQLASVIDKKKKKLTYNTVTAYQKAYSNCNPNLLKQFHWGITTEFGLFQRTIGAGVDADKENGLIWSPGLFAQIPLDENISLRPEILITFPNKQAPSSIQIPLIARYNLNYQTSGKTVPYFELGLLADFKRTETNSLYLNSYNETTSPSLHLLANTETSRFRYGVVLGTGLERKLDSGHSLYAGVRARFLSGKVYSEFKEKTSYYSLNLAFGF